MAERRAGRFRGLSLEAGGGLMPTDYSTLKARQLAANRRWKAKNPAKVAAQKARWRERQRKKREGEIE